MYTFFRHLSGGSEQYHTLVHCLQKDWVTLSVVILLCSLNIVGYLLIAYHWKRCETGQTRSTHIKVLQDLRYIFIFCGICGYLFPVVKIFWPAWRLWAVFMVVLVCVTWRFALTARKLKVIYVSQEQNEIYHKRVGQLIADTSLSAVEMRGKLNEIEVELQKAEKWKP